MTVKHYYRVVCDREAEMAGAGLGHEEIYGDGPRFFWNLHSARERCSDLNRFGSDDLRDTYSVEAGGVYSDGSWDDSDNSYAREQLELPRRLVGM